MGSPFKIEWGNTEPQRTRWSQLPLQAFLLESKDYPARHIQDMTEVVQQATWEP